MKTVPIAIAILFLALWAPACDKDNPPGNDTAAPYLDTVEPVDTVEPLPDTVESLPDTVEPLPDTVEPLPDTVEPLPDTVEPLPDTVEPLPDTVEPFCGDEVCNGAEDPCTCPKDCPVGDGMPGATCCDAMDCAQPKCGPCCVVTCDDFVCSEETWLDDCCWNGECEEGETWENCPDDCPMPPTECEQEYGVCVGWTPGYTNCPPGTVPSGLACTSKSEVCCIEGDDPPPPDCEDFTTCVVDADCVKTNAGCCPCSMGGTSTAINVNCLDAWNDLMDCPPDLMCPAVYNCDNSTPACDSGHCVLVGGGFGF